MDDITQLREIISKLNNDAEWQADLPAFTHGAFFDLFIQFEKEISDIASAHGSEENLDALSDRQNEVMLLAARKKAKDLPGVLTKLALWRWGFDDSEWPELNPADAVIYSAFRDLAEMLGDTAYFKKADAAVL